MQVMLDCAGTRCSASTGWAQRGSSPGPARHAHRHARRPWQLLQAGDRCRSLCLCVCCSPPVLEVLTAARPRAMAPRAATAAPPAAARFRPLLLVSLEEPASKGLVCGQQRAGKACAQHVLVYWCVGCWDREEGSVVELLRPCSTLGPHGCRQRC